MLLLGDLEGNYARVRWLDSVLPPEVPILQVGDFGWQPRHRAAWADIGAALRRRLYWIRGNHEHYPSMPWLDAASPVEVAPNISFVPDGTVLEIDGRRIGCLGGAASIDYRGRTPGTDWFFEEGISQAQLERTEDWRTLDLMVTHCPPASVVHQHFDRGALLYWGVGLDWKDPNMELVEQVWRRVGQPPLVCGHMHRSLITRDGVRILDGNEVMVWPDDAGLQRVLEDAGAFSLEVVPGPPGRRVR